MQYLAPRATMPGAFRWFYYFARIVRYVYFLMMPSNVPGGYSELSRYFRSGSSATIFSNNQIEEKAYLTLMSRLVRANLQSQSKRAK